jgi:uncharacterized membrane protein YeiH
MNLFIITVSRSSICRRKSINFRQILLDVAIVSSIPVHFLDLFGTMIFAVTGALKAIEHKLDIVGVIVLSGIAGLAGGIIRDVVIGRTPPSALVDPLYIIITSITGIGILFLYRYVKNLMRLFLIFDAFGLGIFSLLGANIAFSMFGLNLVIMMFAGVITAVGGGIIRDMLVSEIPLVLRKELYVSVSFVGVLSFFILHYLGVNILISTIIGIIVITSFRIAAIKYNWNLPRRVFRNANGL